MAHIIKITATSEKLVDSATRRDILLAKTALTSQVIQITRPDGRRETVKNPFYLPGKP